MAESTTQELSVEIIYRIAAMLNTEIEKHGEIQINNPTIWNGFLHQMPNEVWRGIVETLLELNKQHPEMVDINQLSALQEAQGLLNRYDQYYDRVMDMKNRHVQAKRVAWKCLMSIREIYNRCAGIRLSNSDHSRVKTNFGELFTDETSKT